MVQIFKQRERELAAGRSERRKGDREDGRAANAIVGGQGLPAVRVGHNHIGEGNAIRRDGKRIPVPIQGRSRTVNVENERSGDITVLTEIDTQITCYRERAASGRVSFREICLVYRAGPCRSDRRNRVDFGIRVVIPVGTASCSISPLQEGIEAQSITQGADFSIPEIAGRTRRAGQCIPETGGDTGRCLDLVGIRHRDPLQELIDRDLYAIADDQGLLIGVATEEPGHDRRRAVREHDLDGIIDPEERQRQIEDLCQIDLLARLSRQRRVGADPGARDYKRWWCRAGAIATIRVRILGNSRVLVHVRILRNESQEIGRALLILN